MVEMIRTTIAQIVSSYSQYAGTGMYTVLYIISLLYIYIIRNNKNNMTLFLNYSLLMIVVIFNPLVAHIIITFIEDQVYWRIFWILPMTIIIAYAATEIIVNISEKQRKIIVLITLFTILSLGGKFIFTSANYSNPSNWYKLPAQTIEVCNIIENDSNGEIRVVVPTELAATIRQYDANINMVYGREGNVFVNDSTYRDRLTLYALMLEYGMDLQSLSKSMNVFKCNYIVFNKSISLSLAPENYGFQYVASTDLYVIYRFNYEEKNATS